MCKGNSDVASREVASLNDLPMLLTTTQAATILNVTPRTVQSMTTTQAATILNVTPRTVQSMCEAGKLRAVRVQSLWRVNRDALLEFAGLELA